MDKSQIIFAGDLPDATLHDRVTRGELVRLARGIYTSDVATPAEKVALRSWKEIVNRRFQDAVVTDRSALQAQPHDGYLFIASQRQATLKLPGFTVVSRKGPGPVDGDTPLGEGVHLASHARAMLDNTRRTRKRGDAPSGTLTRDELADWIDHLCAIDGEARLSTYRNVAESLAVQLDVPDARVEALNQILGAALRTRPSTSGSIALSARSRGTPFDQVRVTRFDLLANYLRDVMTTRPALPEDVDRRATLPFWEAYFSNFIEGTEFLPEEAERIVFEGQIPENRPEDAHDILGTYELLSNDDEMRRHAASAEEFIAKLKSWHRIILGGRRDKNPGRFKTEPNKAGNTVFVAPSLVEGTLRRGYEILESLDTPTQRGAFAGFLVSEVHPFDDGNGRLSRAIMNAEYVIGDEQRAIVPTISRNDYLRATRRLSRQDRPDLYVAYIDRARRWTGRMDWSRRDVSRQLLDDTHALLDPDEAEERGLHLLDPFTKDPALDTTTTR